MKDLKGKLDDAAEEPSIDKRERILFDVVVGNTANDAESVKVKEEALQKLCEIKVEKKDAEGLRQLLTELRPLFAKFPKAKTAKMVRNLIDAISRVPNSTELQVSISGLVYHPTTDASLVMPFAFHGSESGMHEQGLHLH